MEGIVISQIETTDNHIRNETSSTCYRFILIKYKCAIIYLLGIMNMTQLIYNLVKPCICTKEINYIYNNNTSSTL